MRGHGSAGTTAPGRPVLLTGRDAAVDAFRGLAVLLMALGNFEMGVAAFPAWLKHTPDVGYTVADLVAPMFVVAIAWTVGPSMRRRRARDGPAAARRHLLTRALALVGIGAVITAGQSIVRPVAGVEHQWGVLQCLGVATLLLLPVVFRPPAVRAAAGLALLASYQWLLDHSWRDLVLASSHNGLAGSIAWAGLLLLATAVADAHHDRDTLRQQVGLLVSIGLPAVAGSLLLAPWLPVSKAQASATYLLLSLGLSLLVLAVVQGFVGTGTLTLGRLQTIGRNPLLLYLANLLLLAVLTLPAAPGWYVAAPLWLTLLQAATIVAANVGIAEYLDRRGLVVRL